MADRGNRGGRHRVRQNDTTAWIVTFFILYIRFMLMPIDVYSVFLQAFIIVILLVLPSEPEGFTHKFVTSRIAILLVLAYSAEQSEENSKKKRK